jgi:hypothetical protein
MSELAVFMAARASWVCNKPGQAAQVGTVGMGDRGQADKERNIGTETAEDVTRPLM